MVTTPRSHPPSADGSGVDEPNVVPAGYSDAPPARSVVQKRPRIMTAPSAA